MKKPSCHYLFKQGYILKIIGTNKIKLKLKLLLHHLCESVKIFEIYFHVYMPNNSAHF